jgi:hypothetical protein
MILLEEKITLHIWKEEEMNTKAKSLADIAGLQSFPPTLPNIQLIQCQRVCVVGALHCIYTQKSTVAPESRWVH